MHNVIQPSPLFPKYFLTCNFDFQRIFTFCFQSVKPWSGDTREAGDRGKSLYCSLQNCVPFSALVKNLWPLPITGVLCVCVRWCPDDRRPQGATARVGEDCQANVRKGLALGCASITEVPACNQSIFHKVFFPPPKVKAGFPTATQYSDFEQTGPWV